MAADAAAKKKEETPAAAAAAPKAKFDIVGAALILLGLANVGTIGAVGYFTQKLWLKLQDVESQTQKLQAAQAEPPEENPTGKEMEAPAMGLLYPMDSFLVNISSDQGPKFLQTQMELEMADPGTEDELGRKKAAIRDAVIVLLSSRSYKELREPTGIKKLREDLLKSINNLLTTGKIKQIYFTQFHFN